LRTAGAFVSALVTVLKSLFQGTRGERIVLAPGDVAPDFEARASDGRTYRLADYRGRSVVVLAWFPKAFTTGCAAECRSIGLAAALRDEYDAVVFAASCDDVETNRDFAASTGLDVPILCDPTRALARAYGVLGPLGLPSRWTFYIGLDGRILAIDRTVHTGTHGADVASALAQLGVPRRP
jgi:peroxiredoxin Q/BCP